MPNPLFNRQRVTSTSPPNRPQQPMEPVPEPVVGEVFAYRGQEQHGVYPMGGSVGPPVVGDTVDAVFEVADPEPDPVAVRIVGAQRNERPTMRARQVPVQGSAPVQVAGQHNRRAKLTLRAITGGTLFIGGTREQCDGLQGFLCDGTGSGQLDITSQGEVWASTPGGSGGTIYVMEHFTETYRDPAGNLT